MDNYTSVCFVCLFCLCNADLLNQDFGTGNRAVAAPAGTSDEANAE